MRTPTETTDPARVLDATLAGLEAQAEPAEDLRRLSSLLPEYEFQRRIGRGGMGTVYRAFDRRLGRPVAVKILASQLASDPTFAERFTREARALARLAHPNILTVFDFGERGGTTYLVTEFVDGVNLRQLLAMGQLSLGEALKLLPQICEALQFAHDHGVVHRDIKPENILIDQIGRVRIADFGIAKLADVEQGAATLTRPDQALGTPHYMAPEQIGRSEKVDHRADIFSLGVITYEMLTGKLPVGVFDKPSSAADVDPSIDTPVLRSLESLPERRYQRVSEFQRDLRPPTPAAAPPVASAPALPYDPDAPLLKAPIVAVLLLVLAILGCSVGWTLYLGQYRDRALGSLHGIALVVGPFAVVLVAALGASLTGFVGIRAIHAAAGRLRGLACAVVAAYALPLLVVDGAFLATTLDGAHPPPVELVLPLLGALNVIGVHLLARIHAARREGAFLRIENSPSFTLALWAVALLAIDLLVLVPVGELGKHLRGEWQQAFRVGFPIALIAGTLFLLALRWALGERRSTR